MGQMNSARSMNDTAAMWLKPWFCGLVGVFLLTSCGVDGPAVAKVDTTATAADTGGGGSDGTTADTGGADASGVDGAGVSDVAPTTSDTTTDTGTTQDTTATPDTGADAVTDNKDGSGDTAQDGGTATPDAGQTLTLPDCAKNCNECAKCADTPMCVNGQTFLNDCQAICKLQAFDWPTGVTLAQGKCPDCKACKTNTKPDAPDAFCAKTAGGSYVPVKQACELECLTLATAEKCTSGTCPTSGQNCTKDWQCSPKSEVFKGGCGKKNLCMQPKTQKGAACPVNAYQPVCSKKDGSTYATTCAMQACDLSGCFPIGDAAKTTQCTPGKMEIECGGECYDTAKWKNTCPGGCNQVCAVIDGKKSGKARTFRNGCIAKATGAAALNCSGISATSKDKCSAELYQGVTQGACCPDVDYTIIKQVCASKGSGPTATWITFRSQAEFTCLTAAEKGLWSFQYLGPCVCNCPQTSKPVCGDDGLTYQNACQAKCYNGDKFSWKPNACNK